MTQQHKQCPQLRDLSPNIQQFWEEKQQEYGEQLVLFSYAVFLGSPESSSPEKSGILYLMERNLWFEDFPKPPLFLFNRAATYKKTLIQIPRSAITTVELIRRSEANARAQGKISRSGVIQNLFSLFTPDPIYLRVGQRQENGELIAYDFREVNEPKTWIQTFRKV